MSVRTDYMRGTFAAWTVPLKHRRGLTYVATFFCGYLTHAFTLHSTLRPLQSTLSPQSTNRNDFDDARANAGTFTGQQPKCPHYDRELDRQDLQTLLDSKKPWFHEILFENGAKTDAYDVTIDKQRTNMHGLPDSFVGKTVLDVGTFNGAWAQEAVRRGAKHVTSVDYFVWVQNNFHDFYNFCFARAQNGMEDKISYKLLPIEDLAPSEFDDKFDVVFFFGIMYHAEDPIGYLRRIRSVLKPGGMAIVETVVDMLDVPYPASAIYDGEYALNGDDTNDFGPNELGVIAMMKKAGFSRAEVTQRNFVNFNQHIMLDKAKNQRNWTNEVGGRSTFIGYA